jgi:phage gpG-like protein
MAEHVITITGVPEVLNGLEQLNKFFKSTKPMELLTADVQGRILDLTRRSLDYHGRSFAPYSTAYAKFKKKKTGSAKVNLRLSGAMMDALTTEVVNPKKGRVFIGGHNYGRITAEWLAEIHSQGTGPQKQREFMNITKNALRVFIKKRFDDPILNIVRRYFRSRPAGTGA